MQNVQRAPHCQSGLGGELSASELQLHLLALEEALFHSVLGAKLQSLALEAELAGLLVHEKVLQKRDLQWEGLLVWLLIGLSGVQMLLSEL